MKLKALDIEFISTKQTMTIDMSNLDWGKMIFQFI